MMDANSFGGETGLDQRNSLLCSEERTGLLYDEDKEARAFYSKEARG